MAENVVAHHVYCVIQADVVLPLIEKRQFGVAVSSPADQPGRGKRQRPIPPPASTRIVLPTLAVSDGGTGSKRVVTGVTALHAYAVDLVVPVPTRVLPELSLLTSAEGAAVRYIIGFIIHFLLMQCIERSPDTLWLLRVMDSSVGCLVNRVDDKRKYVFSQAAAGILASPRHRSKPGEALVRPKHEVMAFAVLLEQYLSTHILTLPLFLQHGSNFSSVSTSTAIRSAILRAHWASMHEQIRLASGSWFGTASEPALSGSFELFMEVYMLLRCREFIEKSTIGLDTRLQGGHLRSTLQASAGALSKRAEKAARSKSEPAKPKK
jgi:hypothetical protein